MNIFAYTKNSLKQLATFFANANQSVVTIAIIIGGAWTFFQYQYFNNVKLTLDLEKTSIQLTNNNKKTLLAEFKFQNLGNRDVSLCLKDNACASNEKYCELYKIDNEFKIQPIEVPTSSSLDVRTKKNIKSIRVRGGVSQAISCLYEIPEPGWYLTRLYIDVSYSKHNKIPTFPEVIGWKTSKYIYIE